MSPVLAPVQAFLALDDANDEWPFPPGLDHERENGPFILGIPFPLEAPRKEFTYAGQTGSRASR
jgi:hypothetical protein